MTPMATSSAIRAARVSASVSPGTAIMSRPTEQTAVIASSLARVRSPCSTALARAASSLTATNAPESPPTADLRRRGQRQIDDPEGDPEPRSDLAADQLADPRDPEGGALDLLGDLAQ